MILRFIAYSMLFVHRDTGAINPFRISAPGVFLGRCNIFLLYLLNVPMHIQSRLSQAGSASLNDPTLSSPCRLLRRRLRNLLIRIPDLIILPHPMLPPLLANHMLDNCLLARFPHEPADEAGIPEFACDA